MSAPSGFDWHTRQDGAVEIVHHGRPATTLRGDRARDFLDDVDAMDKQDRQEHMARLTGNYRRGNERQAKNHPRNA